MRHDPRYLVQVSKLLPLLWQHSPFRAMSFDDLCDYLAFYWNRGTLCYVMNHDDTPAAVCLIKLFSRLPQFEEDFVHVPNGGYVMIVLMVADTPNAMGQVYEEMVARWKPREIVMWDRGARTESGTPRMYRWDQFAKLARRITYGITESV